MRQDARSRFAGAEAMWSEGRSAREIADHFGVTRNTIIGMTNRNRDRFSHRGGNVGAKVKRDAVREALMARLDEMWAAGMTYREMQEAVGRTVSDIISANRHRYPIRERVKAEVPPKPPKPPKREKTPQAASSTSPPKKKRAAFPGSPTKLSCLCRFCESFHIGHPPYETRNKNHG